MLAKGAQVGNYVVESHLGGGGMAQLYRVKHAVLGTLHALKVLNAGFREMAEVRGRFLTEGMIAAKLNHPNVVKVTDTVSTEEVAGLVMELVMGPNLEQYIRRRKSAPTPEQIRDIFIPVLSAVAAAHQRGIIHRDIKPANILLEENSGRWIPKITDFGIAKVMSDSANLAGKKNATKADARMGTLSYMSPEQIRGATTVTAQSDIFSLGATLYELATCEVAFDGNSDYDVMHRIIQGQQQKPELLARLDPQIAAAISRSLQPDPDQRFLTCEDFAAALSIPRDSGLPVKSGRAVAAAEAPATASSAPPEALPASAGSLDKAARKPCPYCNEIILASAKKCRHCLEYLDVALRPTSSPSPGRTSLVPSAATPPLTIWQIRGQVLLSLLVPGVGQLVGRRTVSGLLWLGSWILIFKNFSFGGALLIHIASALHAYRQSTGRS